MKRISGNLSFFLITVIGFILFSCGGGQQKNEQAEAEAEFDAKTEELRTKIRGIFGELPDASEVGARIQATGADFNADLIHDPARAEDYLEAIEEEGRMALVLGIYASDLGYLVAYEEAEMARDHFGAAKQLSDQLGTTRAFTETVANRFAEQIVPGGEGEEMLNKAFAGASENLRSEGRDLIATASAVGFFLENTYLVTQLIDSYPKDMLPEDARNVILSPLVKTVLERKVVLDQLIELTEAVVKQRDPEGKSDAAAFFIADLKDLDESFGKLNISEQMDDPGLVLNDETLAEITEKVSTIRARILQ